jgi:hypothetical protein
MCGHKFWASPGAPPPLPEPPIPRESESAPITPPPPPEAPRAEKARDGWTQPILIVAFILILAGLALDSGKGTALLWLGLAPAFAITALSGFQSPNTIPHGGLQKLQFFVTKLASVVAIVILAGVALTLSLAAACTAIVAGFSVVGHH